MLFRRSIAGCAFALAIIALENEPVAQDIDAETWRVGISLDVSKLVPPAVQFAIFDKDPVPGFKTRVKQMSSWRQERIQPADDGAVKEQTHSINMAVQWNFGFKEITGDKVYLLTPGPDASDVYLMSNGPGDKKWLVTKVRSIKGKPVCWCIPIEVKTGKEIQVALTKDNMFDLSSASQTDRDD